MTTLATLLTVPTHEVTNQVPPLVGHDVADDPVMPAGVVREEAGWALPDLHRLGRRAGSAQAQESAEQANRYPPELRTHDRSGHPVDEVAFPPRGTRCWTPPSAPGRGRRLGRPTSGRPCRARCRLPAWGQVEAGHGCPVSMTYASSQPCGPSRR